MVRDEEERKEDIEEAPDNDGSPHFVRRRKSRDEHDPFILNERLSVAKRDIEKLEDTIFAMKKTIEKKDVAIEKLSKERETLLVSEARLQTAAKSHDQELTNLREQMQTAAKSHDQELANLREQMQTATQTHERETETAANLHALELANLREQMQTATQAHERELANIAVNHDNQLSTMFRAHQREIGTLTETHKEEADRLAGLLLHFKDLGDKFADRGLEAGHVLTRIEAGMREHQLIESATAWYIAPVYQLWGEGVKVMYIEGPTKEDVLQKIEEESANGWKQVPNTKVIKLSSEDEAEKLKDSIAKRGEQWKESNFGDKVRSCAFVIAILMTDLLCLCEGRLWDYYLWSSRKFLLREKGDV